MSLRRRGECRRVVHEEVLVVGFPVEFPQVGPAIRADLPRRLLAQAERVVFEFAAPALRHEGQMNVKC